MAPRTVLCLPSYPLLPAPRHTALQPLPAHSCATLFHAKSCHGNHDTTSLLHSTPKYTSLELLPRYSSAPRPPTHLQHPPARCLLLVCLRLGLLLTATNAQSSQIISFNVNTKTASSRSSSSSSSDSGSGLALAVVVAVAVAASLPSPSTSSATAASWRALKAESLTLQFSMARWANKLSGSDRASRSRGARSSWGRGRRCFANEFKLILTFARSKGLSWRCHWPKKQHRSYARLDLAKSSTKSLKLFSCTLIFVLFFYIVIYLQPSRWSRRSHQSCAFPTEVRNQF